MTQDLRGFVSEFMDKAAREPEALFAVFEGERITFRQLLDDSAKLASYFHHAGLRSGDRVAVMMRNSRHSLAILMGIARAGAVWVPVNAQQKGDGLRHILEDSKPSLLIAEGQFLSVIELSGVYWDADKTVSVGDPGREVSVEAILKGEVVPLGTLPSPVDLFAIMYTSGTTGRPKGVLVTHGMLRLAGEAVQLLTDMKSGDVFFVWEPLFHIGGAQLLVLPIIADVTLAMVDRFSASKFWNQVREAKATHIHYLGGILQILLKQEVNARDRDHGVRIAWGGGCPKEIWTDFSDRFGVEVRECYGMTEASSLTTANRGGVVGSVGTPLPWFSVTIEDANGTPLPAGERGEIVVRSTRSGALFGGYLNNEEETAKALVDGALRTGDAGILDDQRYLWFFGRITDSVRCRGENVSAWEVEHVVASHPEVEDCAMIGVKADIGEQDIKLFVKPKSDSALDPSALSSWLSERLAGYQNPRYIAFVRDFERTPSQRIKKHLLPIETDESWDRLSVR